MHLKSILLSTLALGMFACGGSSGGNASDDAGPSLDAGEPSYPSSPKSRLRFKGNRRINSEFARILSLLPGEVCSEFGLYSCANLVHTVALGGADPYGLGLHEALPFTTVTTPLAVDRIALSACRTRVDKDLSAGAAALIYKGTLDNADGEDVATAVDALYKRAVLRPASAEELASLRQLHRDIADLNGGTVPRDWAIASCFAVTSSLEQLFY